MIPLQNITTLFFLFIILIGRSDSTYFCDLKAIDNVFNVGHLVYMTRCGEVWTYDPRMYAEKSRGGFIRDYSWFAFAKRFFAHNLFNEHKTYDNKLLHFTAFSFQEVNCDETFENLDKDCYGSVKAWNGLSVMADKYEARTFRYETDMEHLKNNNDNPLGFGGTQLMNTSERNAFWPDIQDVAKDWLKMNLGPGKGSVHSALFSVKENTLYIVLQANNSKYYCLTHTNMNEMLHDVRRWPTKKGNGPQWAKCKPFTGNVVGMFYDENQGQAYIVGRVRYDHRKYEDTIYYLNIDSPNDNDELVPIDPIIISDQANLRTHFGCDVQNNKIEPKARASKRRKRSIEYQRSTIDWKALKQEVKRDWKYISVMSVTALVLIGTIFKFLQQIQFK